MKKVLALGALGCLLFSGIANAAMYRVDFNGTVSDGTYDGFFTYDDTGLNLNTQNYNSGDGLETDLAFNIATTAYTASLDETQAGVVSLTFNSGSLTSWVVGGNESETSTVIFGSSLPFDFLLGDYVSLFNFPGTGYADGTLPQWSVREISAVPLPAAAWAFGAGLLALFGVKRRRKGAAALAA